MDWLFISQLIIFGLYVTLLYHTHKSGVGELKNGERLDSIFWTRFFQIGMMLGIGLGMLGGLVILFSVTFIFRHIDEMNLWVETEWNTLVYFIFVASFIYLTTVYSKITKDKIIRNYKCDIKKYRNYTLNSVIHKVKHVINNGNISEEDLEQIIEEEQKIINSTGKYKSPFRDSIFDD